MSRSEKAASVIAELDANSLMRVVHEFPLASAIVDHCDAAYFAKVVKEKTAFNSPQKKLQALNDLLAEQQSELMLSINHYQCLLSLDLSWLDDALLIRRFEKKPLNGMRESLWIGSNTIAFHRSMITALMKSIEEVTEDSSDSA